MVKRYAIGVDIGGTNVRAALINHDGEIISKVKNATGKDPLSAANKLIDSVYSSHSKEIHGIGVAVAGLVDSEAGTVLKSPNMPKLNGENLKSAFKKRYKTSVEIENDANAAAYGEKCAGAGRDLESFFLFTLGTGIGGGIVMNGKLLPVAAEVGHMSINAAGNRCPCGNAGCLELYASATAIIGGAVSELEKGSSSILKDLHNGNFYRIKAEDIYKAALEGDPLSRNILRDAGKNLGIGIASIINLLSPEAVILTGGLIGAWNIYIEAAIKEASKGTFSELYERVKIIPSSLGDDAGIIGASSLIFERTK